ncbi:quinone-dependent dihydroorotate dehydrogenase [Haloechinothrix sp. LS1_15]|uniref:quinone-dependent dihydroorotate dehydrogenase n=1 Tax=Haloechinothrix sp. LS1_15 TaxID=2652248 RepID=UPI002946DA93|nr:quinone-dependent dihydroorotate dehydrogenase [Haloechinothrix sp. LS1_15]MDV6012167.1 quinone-dependent dihydroorotate dehydrogenase [Haloechinothrix sp. LS1_15]
MSGRLFRSLLRPALYQLAGRDPETVHERTLAALARLSATPTALAGLRKLYAVDAPVTVFGLRFANPVGLAAGMDKDAAAPHAWPALGFGFAEIGTVTRWPQPGNPRPRLFQLPRSRAVINRMGFNNAGAEALAARLATAGKSTVPLGISIGKSKATDLADAVTDYTTSLRLLHPYADYVAVNVSSPNTPGLRSLQDRGALAELLAELRNETARLAEQRGTGRTPVLVKVAPDLTEDALAELLDVCAQHEVAGIIATNTTLARDGLHPAEAGMAVETGGLSGRPLAARAVEVVRFLHRTTDGTMPIIGVGGICVPDDALRMLDAGASLIQLYTGFAYSGPGLVKGINKAIGRAPAR